MQSQPSFIRLSELNQQLQDLLYSVYDRPIWIVAEIASLRSSPRGHCYLELVEKGGDTVLAQMRANIWADKYRTIEKYFSSVTGSSLAKGMKILFCASLDFHPVYSLSLGIINIEPAFTLGEKARQKTEILERLTKEGHTERNKNLPFPKVPQRIAVISSATAAGYEDFINQLLNNSDRIRFNVQLFKAVMQGANALNSIMKQLDLLQKEFKNFDVIVILRGGGAEMDLDCFDNYELAKEVSFMDIPVISGIGHHRDDTILDHVAHTRVKTPTAAADFLIEKCLEFETRLMGIHEKISNRVLDLIQEERDDIQNIESSLTQGTKEKLYALHLKFKELSYNLKFVPLQKVFNKNKTLQLLLSNLRSEVEKNFNQKKEKFNFIRKNLPAMVNTNIQHVSRRIENFEKTTRHLDPQNILKRGFSITLENGRILKDLSQVKAGNLIDTRLFSGSIQSRVEAVAKN